MLAEFAVLKSVDPADSASTSFTIEWPSGIEDDAWVRCGEVVIKEQQGFTSKVHVIVNDQFYEDVAEEYPHDERAAELELKKLCTVVAYYLPTLPMVSLATEVEIIAPTRTGQLDARLYPAIPSIDFVDEGVDR